MFKSIAASFTIGLAIAVDASENWTQFFRFPSNIVLETAKENPNVLATSLFLDDSTGELQMVPGRILQRDGCTLTRTSDPGVRQATVLGAEAGNKWHITLVSKKTPKDPKRRLAIGSFFSLSNISKDAQLTTFDLVNERGDLLNLVCRETCTNGYVFFKEVSTCTDEVPNQILEELGVQPPRDPHGDKFKSYRRPFERTGRR